MLFSGIGLSQTGDPSSILISPYLMAMGIFIVMFGFRPSLGADIVKAITNMFKILMKALASMLR